MLTQTVVIKSKKSSLMISASAKRRKVLLAGTGSFSPDQLPDLFRVLKDFASTIEGMPKAKGKVKIVKRRQRKPRQTQLPLTQEATAPSTETPKPRRLRRSSQPAMAVESSS